MPRAYESKKRRVTTCTECQQRKQRCDRQLPCQCCIRRRTPEKCFYRSTARVSAHPGTRLENGLEEEPRESSVEDGVNGGVTPTNGRTTHEVPQLSSQIGYQFPQRPLEVPNVVDEIQPDTNHSASSKPLKSTLYPRKIGRDKWSRYCKFAMPSLDQALVQSLVNVFFDEANWYFTVLDRYYFDVAQRSWLRCQASLRAASHTGFLAEDLSFPALLYQVIAIGVQFVPEKSILAEDMTRHSSPSTDDLSRRLSDTGDAISDLIGRHHRSINSVQADLMRCAWLKNSGEGAEAWHKLGSAIRQAQDIGLHLEPSEVDMLPDTAEFLSAAWYNEHKRRLWACLFTWESHMALQLGRSRSFHASDCTISMPIDADMPQEPARTLFRPTGTNDRPPTVSSQIIKYGLAQMIQDLMSSRAFDHETENHALIQSTHQQVLGVLRELPPALRATSTDTSWDVTYPDVVKHRLQISIIANAFLLAIHRPHVKRRIESLDAAIDAAMQVLNLSQRLFERTPAHQHKTFTLIFYTIDAGILLAAMTASIQREDGRWQIARQCLREAINRLAVLKRRNRAAAAGQRALESMLQRLHTTDEASSDHASIIRQRRRAQANHLETNEPLATPASDQLDGSTVVGSSNDTILQDLDDSWDFLPTFDDPADILTAMTVNGAFTAEWLEQTLDSMSSLDYNADNTGDDWVGSFS